MSRRTGPARTASLRIRVPARVAFDRLTTLPFHGRLIPLTHVAAPDRPARIGDVVTAVSAGVLRDVMVVTDAGWEDAGERVRGSVRLVKTGPVLLGWASIVVVPLGEHACLVRWSEHIRLRRTSGALLSRAGALMAARALRRARAILQHEGEPRPSPTGPD